MPDDVVMMRSGTIAAYLGRIDCDPPRRRLALCFWSPRERRWMVERGHGSSGWTELHVLGEILFGESPWRRACVLRVFGRLGSVELAVSRLAMPGPDFVYEFAFEIDPDKARGAVRAKYSSHEWAHVEEAFWRGLSEP